MLMPYISMFQPALNIIRAVTSFNTKITGSNVIVIKMSNSDLQINVSNLVENMSRGLPFK